MALQLLQQAERAKEMDGIVVNSAIRACEQVAHLGCLGMSWNVLGSGDDPEKRLEKMVQDGEFDQLATNKVMKKSKLGLWNGGGALCMIFPYISLVAVSAVHPTSIFMHRRV